MSETEKTEGNLIKPISEEDKNSEKLLKLIKSPSIEE